MKKSLNIWDLSYVGNERPSLHWKRENVVQVNGAQKGWKWKTKDFPELSPDPQGMTYSRTARECGGN